MKRLTALVSDVTLKNLQNRLDRLTGSDSNLHLGLVKTFLHSTNMHTACNQRRVPTALEHMLLENFLVLLTGILVQFFQQGDPGMTVWLTFRRRCVGRFGLLLFIVECTSGRQHSLDHWIVLGKLHSHQAGSLKFSDIHGILECELCEDLDALHEKLFAASSLPLRGLAIISTCARPWGQKPLG